MNRNVRSCIDERGRLDWLADDVNTGALAGVLRARGRRALIDGAP